MSQYRQPAEAGAANGIPLKSPLTGLIAQSFAGNGRYVEGGEKLSTSSIAAGYGLEARVPEADSARVLQVTGAAFRIDGFDGNFEIKPGDNGRLVSLSTEIDPVQRTLPVVFELDHPEAALGRLRAGAAVPGPGGGGAGRAGIGPGG